MTEIKTPTLADTLKEISIVDTILDQRRFTSNGVLDNFTILKTDKPIKFFGSDTNAKAKIYAEGDTPATQDSKLTEHVLNPRKRVARVMEFSKQFFEESEVFQAEYIAGEMAESITRGIEDEILITGTPDGTEPRNLQRLVSNASVTADGTSEDPLPLKDVKFARSLMMSNKGNLKKAYWLLNKGAELSVKDESGNECLSYENIPEGADATLLGIPVRFVGLGDTDIVKDNKDNITSYKPGRAILVAPNSYTIAMSDVETKQIQGDTLQGIKGSVLIKSEVLIDSKMTHPYGRIGISNTTVTNQ